MEHSPDVLLLDLKLPELDGLGVLSRAAGAADKHPGAGPDECGRTGYRPGLALQAGAAGFLYKDVDPDALVRAIRSVHDGHTVLAPEAAGLVTARPAGNARGIGALTGRERDVLELLADGRLQPRDRKDAARLGEDRQDPRQRRPRQARRSRPDASRAARRPPSGLSRSRARASCRCDCSPGRIP